MLSFHFWQSAFSTNLHHVQNLFDESFLECILNNDTFHSILSQNKRPMREMFGSDLDKTWLRQRPSENCVRKKAILSKSICLLLYRIVAFRVDQSDLCFFFSVSSMEPNEAGRKKRRNWRTATTTTPATTITTAKTKTKMSNQQK